MTTGVVILVALLLAAVVVLGAIAVRRRRPDDDVDSFRRQIDALSPESRRPTIDRMKPSEPPPADDDGDDAS